MASSNEELTLGYWGVRGRAGSIRNLLAYCGIPFQQKTYSSFREWASGDKEKLGLEYPNIPYLIDGSKKITESIAILHYIALKVGKRSLIGETGDQIVQVQTALGVISDFRNELRILAFTKADFQKEKEQAFTSGAVKKKLDVLEKNLEGKDWICGFFSIADFTLFESVEMAKDMEPKVMSNYNNLAGFQKRFSEIPSILSHRQSKDFFSAWFLPGIGTWNNEKTG